MEVKKISSEDINDFISLISIFNEVFENSAKIPTEQHLLKLLSNPDFMVFVTKIAGKVVGGLTIYVLHQYYSEKPLAYIYDVGILPDFQGKGIGKALISVVTKYCGENGFDAAYVEAEFDDTDANIFYQKTNFSSQMRAIHYTYTF